MTPKTLKIALAISVALNLFAIVAGATTLIATRVTEDRVERRVEEHRRPGREGPSILAPLETMDPAVRDRVREAMRASALAARPDFEASRSDRRAAVAMMAAEPVRPAEIRALLERSRDAEARGRARLEDGAIAVLTTLEPADRAALAPILSRGGRGNRGERRQNRRMDDRSERPAPVQPPRP